MHCLVKAVRICTRASTVRVKHMSNRPLLRVACRRAAACAAAMLARCSAKAAARHEQRWLMLWISSSICSIRWWIADRRVLVVAEDLRSSSYRAHLSSRAYQESLWALGWT